MQQLVSVIIPTYKGADKINSAVDSVLNQTYKNIEVIVVDDNGENEPEQLLTAEKMKKYETFENVKYLVHKKNINGSAARNTGIRASKGFYLGFLDDDDVFLPDKTQKQVDCFEKLPDDYAMIYGSFLEHMTENTDRIVKADNADNFLYRFLCNEIIACSSTIMIKRSVLDYVKEWDESFKRHQDLEFFARVACGCRVACISDVCIEKFKLDRNMPKGELYEQYRLHYLNKMKPIIEQFIEKEQKRLYNIHYTEIGKAYLKQKQLKKAMHWAFKTSNPAKALFLFVKDGMTFILRK